MYIESPLGTSNFSRYFTRTYHTKVNCLGINSSLDYLAIGLENGEIEILKVDFKKFREFYEIVKNYKNLKNFKNLKTKRKKT